MLDTNDLTIFTIMILFPLAAGMVVFQSNPYYALVTRGILGAVAALVYALLGAADVALTEALVGTMLAVTLYAVAVRSSLVMRLGVLEQNCQESSPGEICQPETQAHFTEIIAAYRQVIAPYYLRLELVPYPDLAAITAALSQREVHGICTPTEATTAQSFKTLIRVQRLFEILQAGLNPTLIHHTCLELFTPADSLPSLTLEEAP